MTTTIRFICEPDEALGLSTVTKTVPIEDLGDYQVLLAMYREVCHVGYTTDENGQEVDAGLPPEALHEATITAMVKSLMDGVKNTARRWVEEKKKAEITTTAPDLVVL